MLNMTTITVTDKDQAEFAAGPTEVEMLEAGWELLRERVAALLALPVAKVQPVR